MSKTLAQIIMDHGIVARPAVSGGKPSPFRNTSERLVAEDAAKLVATHLRRPRNEKAPTRELHRIAERFVFEEFPTRVIHDLIDSKQIEYKTVVESMRLPASAVWLEWDNEKIEGEEYATGFLVVEVTTEQLGISSARTIAIAVVGEKTKSEQFAAVAGVFSLPPLPAKAVLIPEKGGRWGISVTCHWWCRPNDKEDVPMYAFDLMNALFLLSVPRVCEVRDSPISEKLQRARARRGKTPLLDVRRVRIRVGKGTPRYERGDYPDRSGDPDRRRYHRVIGHFRTYAKNRDTPRVSFVEEHWRGDPELGILLHERIVER